MVDYVDIQFQITGGNWLTCNTTLNSPQTIYFAMRNLQRSHPGKRIRAITKDGRLVDILT